MLIVYIIGIGLAIALGCFFFAPKDEQDNTSQSDNNAQ